MLSYVLFLISASLVIYAGIRLSTYGDVIAARTGLGHSFVGITLIAFSTSLPEVISSIGAVTIVDAPDLAFGNVYGSNMFNMLVIFIMDAMNRKVNVFNEVSTSNMVTTGFAVTITAVSVFGFVVPLPDTGWISTISIGLFLVYLLSMYSAYRLAADESNDDDDELPEMTLRQAAVYFSIAAVTIVIAGLLMSKSADAIALETGLGRTRVGSFLLAIVTSLPELSVCIAAVKIGAANMAIGNLVGSNVFNMTVIPICDLFYTKGGIFAAVAPAHLVSSLFVMVVTGIAITGIVQNGKLPYTIKGISLYSWLILGGYALYFLYMASV